jgi:hypothetical protein
MPDTVITFARLPEIPLAEIIAHMSEPKVAEHMPLLTTSEWDEEMADGFVTAKERCWQRDGLGHWAFLADGEYVGWGGFQKEGDEWDFGLVLRPDRFGLGMRIANKALAFARDDDRIPFVTFLLPPTRTRLGALKRLGARFIETVDYEGEAFMKFWLETS